MQILGWDEIATEQVIFLLFFIMLPWTAAHIKEPQILSADNIFETFLLLQKSQVFMHFIGKQQFTIDTKFHCNNILDTNPAS